MAQHLSGQQLTSRSTTRLDEPGALRVGVGGRVYRYVRFLGPVIKGQPLATSCSSQAVSKQNGWRVTKAASVLKSGRFAGVAIGSGSTSEHGYILVNGPLGGPDSHYIITDTGIANGDYLVKDESTAGMIDTFAKSAIGTQIAWIMGRATAADSGSYLAKGFVTGIMGIGGAT